MEKSGNESPIVSFIQLERYNAIRLVQTVHQSLASLSKVIRGTQLLNKDVQNLAAALLNQEVKEIAKQRLQDDFDTQKIDFQSLHIQ